MEEKSHSTDGSHGNSCCPLFAKLSRDLGLSQFLTKFYEFLSSTVLQFDAVSLLYMFHDDLATSPIALARGHGCPGNSELPVWHNYTGKV